MVKKLNLVNQKFGRLTVIEYMESDKMGKANWKCICDCGNFTKVRSGDLMNGHIKSCGCLRNESTMKRRTKHNMSQTPIYICWNNMKQRCTNPHATGYEYYGAKGIRVCKEWQNFKNFYNWAISNGWKEGMTIERIDIYGAYEPDNCKWITKQEQKYNRSDSHFITYNGKTQTLAQWAKEIGVCPSSLRYRLSHWPLEKAITNKKYR